MAAMESPNAATQNTQDLHELVTLEPNNSFYSPNALPVSSSDAAPLPHVQASNRHVSAPVFNHASSIFSPGYIDRPSSPTETTSPEASTPRPRLSLVSHDGPGEASSSVRWSQPPSGARSGLIRKAPMQRAEKDSDDVDSSLDRRRRSFQLNSGASTSTAINRLFAGKSALSPEASRAPSYHNRSSTPGITYMRSLSNETATLPQHLQQRGLVEGRHSDITLKVFGTSYMLHRIILDRAPFFASALSEPWAEAHQKEVELHPEEIDSTITQRTFELALKRLYGCNSASEEDAEAIGLFATGCWLEMQDLIDYSVESILRRMQAGTVAPMLHLVTSNYYGKAGDKILASAKAVICRNGWQMPLRFWDGISSDLILELVGGDGFFVHGEWERWLLAKRLLDRRLKAAAKAAGLWDHGFLDVPFELRAHAIRSASMFEYVDAASVKDTDTELDRWISLYKLPEIEPLLMLLDEAVHYMHLEFEQLQSIRSARDVFGVPLMPEKIIADALWSGLELRQRVLNAREKELTLGLSQAKDDGPRSEVHDSSLPSGFVKKRTEKPQLRSTDSLLNLGNEMSTSKRYWIPSTDCNVVIGGNTESVITSTTNANRQVSRLSSALQPEESGPWLNDLASENVHDAAPGDGRPTSFSAFPPFRFSAEFPNPRVLKERKRVYSRTVFYAGSLWNVYIQKVRSGSKNPQLGVYLHRAKERDPEGSTGAVPTSVEERTGAWERDLVLRAQQRSFRQRTRTFLPDTEPSGHVDLDDLSSGADGDLSTPRPGLSTFMTSSRRKTSARHSMEPGAYSHLTMPGIDASAPYFSSSSATPVSDASDSDDAYDLYNEPSIHVRSSAATLPPYTDARPTIKTYFKIYSPSKGGRTMSVYESAPDNFNFSQSWGWKSSSLMLEDELEDSNSPFGPGLSTGLRSEEGDDEPLTSGVVGAEEGLMGSSIIRDDDGTRANLRFMVVLGVV